MAGKARPFRYAGAAVTALQGLRGKGRLKSGQSVLINGASGGVGTFAVQNAAAFGSEVTGVYSSGGADMLRSFGVKRVIDYTREDFADNGYSCDLILDIAANRSVSDCKRALKQTAYVWRLGFQLSGI
jgi:NADPH:quinone reductase-like Zn-dependent oxidoreductase